MARISLDANILVYAIDTSDSARHRVARRIISSAAQRDCVLTLQALSEFYFVVTRKGKLAAEQARAQVAALRARSARSRAKRSGAQEKKSRI